MPFSNSEIAVVKGMIARGDKQSDIAAYFGVNGGRISEVNTQKHGSDVKPAPQDQLPVRTSPPVDRPSEQLRRWLRSAT